LLARYQNLGPFINCHNYRKGNLKNRFIWGSIIEINLRRSNLCYQ